MPREIWKPIFRGYYEVSNLGRVRRAKPGSGTQVGRICKQQYNPVCGYFAVWIWVEGKRTVCFVHKLVAFAFLGPRPKGKEVNHKNLDKTDNRAKNLEYLTHAANMEHAHEHGAFKNVYGENGLISIILKKKYHSGEIQPYKRTPKIRKKNSESMSRENKLRWKNGVYAHRRTKR